MNKKLKESVHTFHTSIVSNNHTKHKQNTPKNHLFFTPLLPCEIYCNNANPDNNNNRELLPYLERFSYSFLIDSYYYFIFRHCL